MVIRILRDVYFFLAFAVTIFVGVKLSVIVDYQIFKVFNVIGTLWEILGFVIATYLIYGNQHFKVRFVNISGYVFKVLIMLFPLGIVLGALLSGFLYDDVMSHKKVMVTGIFLLFPALISMYLIEIFAESPVPKFAQGEDFRILFLGGYFICSGLILNFVASVFDLLQFNG